MWEYATFPSKMRAYNNSNTENLSKHLSNSALGSRLVDAKLPRGRKRANPFHYQMSYLACLITPDELCSGIAGRRQS